MLPHFVTVCDDVGRCSMFGPKEFQGVTVDGVHGTEIAFRSVFVVGRYFNLGISARCSR